MKKFGMALLVIAVIFLIVVVGMLYFDVNVKNEEAIMQTAKISELENKINDLENQLEEKQETEKSSEQANIENIQFKEGTYINSDDPEAHFLTLKNGKAEAVTFGTSVGTYTIEENKIYVVYTEEYDPEGNPCQLEVTEEVYRIEGDTLVQEKPYQMVYKLQ